MKKFTFLLTAALFCGSLATFAQDLEEYVSPAINEDTFEPAFQFNKDDAYYVIYLDDATQKKLDADQLIYIGADDNAHRKLYIWDTKSAQGDGSSFVDKDALPGNNSFDEPGNFMSYKVGYAGWSGFGYCVTDDATPLDLSGINEDYTFHMAVKSTSDQTFDFYLVDGNKKEAHIVLGQEDFKEYEPLTDFPRDDMWYNIDIPVSDLEDMFSLSYKDATSFKGNIFCLLAGGVPGTIVDYDAVFFYGPKGTGTGIKDVTANTEKTAAEYYTIDGKKVSTATAKANKGVYVVKQGDKTKKVVID